MSLQCPRITVVVPVYNSASTLERALRSVLRQSLTDIEVLVLDDGSTDASAAVATHIAGEDCRVRVILSTPNAGKSAAMNRMIAEAYGDWIAVLDADDAYHDDRLRILLAVAEAQDVDLVADNIVYIDAGADCVIRTAFDPSTPDRVVGLGEFWKHSDPHADFDFGILKPMFRRSFLLEHHVSYYSTSLSEDFYYLLKAFLAGARGVIVGQPLYFWTMPFGPLSRAWTSTGNGAWRYDYRQAIAANEYFIAEARARSDSQTVKTVTGPRSAISDHATLLGGPAGGGTWKVVAVACNYPSPSFYLPSTCPSDYWSTDSESFPS